MNTTQLLTKFNQAINWNALFYTLYKISSTATTFALFYRVPTTDFATWTNIHALVFLALLWLDCGLRKTIPRFAPHYTQSTQTLSAFAKNIIIFYSSLLIVATPILVFIQIKYFWNILQLDTSWAFLYLSILLFITEGCVALLGLLYHSYFCQKQFNSISSIMLLAQSIATLILFTFNLSSTGLIVGVIACRIISALCISIISIIGLEHIHADYVSDMAGAQNNRPPKTGEFIKHAALMGTNSILKSLSERNFIIPMLTLIVGPGQANLFKLANDGALLFQRIVLKTVGTTDTSLLSHALMHKDKMFWQIAFKRVGSKIAGLCIPLLGIVGLLALQFSSQMYNLYVFQLFFIITTGYLIESMILPFERVMEVKRDYGLLILTYVPYVFSILILFLTSIHTSIGLRGCILFILFVRLVSVLSMGGLVYLRYRLTLPFSFILSRLFLISLLTLSIHLGLTSIYTYLPLSIRLYSSRIVKQVLPVT